MIQLLQSSWEDRFRVSTTACFVIYLIHWRRTGKLEVSVSHLLCTEHVQAIVQVCRKGEGWKMTEADVGNSWRSGICPSVHLIRPRFWVVMGPGVNPLMAGNVISSQTHTLRCTHTALVQPPSDHRYAPQWKPTKAEFTLQGFRYARLRAWMCLKRRVVGKGGDAWACMFCFWTGKKYFGILHVSSQQWATFCCITKIAVHNNPPLELLGHFQLHRICASFSNPGVFGFSQPRFCHAPDSTKRRPRDSEHYLTLQLCL